MDGPARPAAHDATAPIGVAAGAAPGVAPGAGNAPGLPFAESLGFLVRDLNRAIQREIGLRLAAHGVPPGAWYLLRLLWEEDGLTQRELAARVGMAEPTAVVALRGMEGAGWIRRARSATDARKVHIHLTEAGRALRERVLPVAQAVNAQVAHGLSADEAAFLRALLRRARANFPGAPPESEPG